MDPLLGDTFLLGDHVLCQGYRSELDNPIAQSVHWAREAKRMARHHSDSDQYDHAGHKHDSTGSHDADVEMKDMSHHNPQRVLGRAASVAAGGGHHTYETPGKRRQEARVYSTDDHIRKKFQRELMAEE